VTDLLTPLRDVECLAEGAMWLPGFARDRQQALLAAVAQLSEAAPPRRMTVPGGGEMSVAMTNCGALGWVADRMGYRYSPVDPMSGTPWPAMPAMLAGLAREAAAAAGYPGFVADACLINRYETGARMGLHQDRDERDLAAPIVSVSLAAPCVFLWGGLARRDKVRRLALQGGDVVVWGGASRLTFHGVDRLAAGPRVNLTFRKAG
jgi:alkylated DNA repair protein (DNA oxidative demethylase)